MDKYNIEKLGKSEQGKNALDPGFDVKSKDIDRFITGKMYKSGAIKFAIVIEHKLNRSRLKKCLNDCNEGDCSDENTDCNNN